MQLEKQHRECLINELQKAREDKENNENYLRTNKGDNLVGWWEIHIFLADEKIKLIERSLIDNEIDF